jgi:hypothetical protein
MPLPLRARGFALAPLSILACLLLALALPAGARAAEACPNEQLRHESNLNQQTGVRYSAELPDCRAYEVVTPVEKGQANILSEGAGAHGGEPFQQAAEDGEGIMYNIEDALPGDESGPLFGNAVAFPSGDGWLTTLLAGPQLIAEAEVGSVNTFNYYSPNLTCAADETKQPMEKLASGALAPMPAGEVAGEVINLYLWSKATDAYTLVSNTNPANRLGLAEGHASIQVYGVTPDCSRVVFATEYRFLPEAPTGGSGLYEWDEGVLRLVSLRPDGTATAVANLPSARGSIVGAVSTSGARIFFTGISDHGNDSGKTEVFLREGEQTVEVSESKTGRADNEAQFQAAASDGSQVLFLATYGLTASSSKGLTTCSPPEADGSRGCDLYDYDVETKALTDLTADTNVGDSEGADVQGVLGMARDASYVYFAALGQLSASDSSDSQTEAENEAHGEVNVYVWHGGQLGYVATIKDGENGGESENFLARSEDLTSRVNPSGLELLFTSTGKLTAFENTAGGGTKESELYLYSVSSHSVACVSCDPSGVRAVGPAVTSSPGFNNGYAPRNLNDEGDQVFFTSEDPLAAGAAHGINAYEWEREGAGACTEHEAHEAVEYSGGCIYLLAADGSVHDASASGDDVFVGTRLPLVPQDPDGLEDIYDVKVDSGFPAPTQASCSGEECQGELNGALSFSSPGSVGAPAIGNALPSVESKAPVKPVAPKALTRAQELANALKACKKEARKKRAGCELKARERYGAKAKSKPKTKGKTKSKKSPGKGGK